VVFCGNDLEETSSFVTVFDQCVLGCFFGLQFISFLGCGNKRQCKAIKGFKRQYEAIKGY